MKKSIHILSVTLLFALFITTKSNAQFASDHVADYAKQMMQKLPAQQRNVHHNTLTASNRNILPSNSVTHNNIQQKIPVQIRSRKPGRANNIPRNRPTVLPSNSPTLAQQGHPKRPPTLPVAF